MNRQELEMWLCGPDAPVLAPAEIASALGLPLHEVGDTTLMRAAERLHALCFTVAVLRDLFPTDEQVRGWLRRPHGELGGRRPVDLLRSGREHVVGELAAEHWHHPPAEVAAARAWTGGVSGVGRGGGALLQRRCG